MYYREAIIEDDKALGNSGTETIDINIIDPITELLLKFKLTNTTGTSADEPPEVAITKIELVDGGQVYMSLSGFEAVAAACYDKGFWPPHWYCEVASANQRLTIPLQFGRYIGDPEYAFDPTRLKNPQLKFTYAKDTAHLSGSLTLGVLAKVMEGVPAPGKALFYKTVESFSVAASGVHTTELPIDYPYRRVLVRAIVWDDSTAPASIITHHKLDCDVGKLIVFDHDAAEFEDILRGFFGEFHIRKYDVQEAKSDGKMCLMAGRTVAIATPQNTNRMCQAWASGAVHYTLSVITDAGVEPTDEPVQTLITGEFPHSTYCYQFGDPDKPETWFNAPQFRDIDLKLTQGNSSAAASVVLQQPRSLP